jgi:ABC-type branched-subunit amino acid transport system ATPase component
MPLLKVEKISKSFGEHKVFEKISFQLEVGKIYSLNGANGSGKTTLLNILTGFLKADGGSILFNDIFINSKTPHQINRIGISRTFQDLRLINNLKVIDNILLVLDKKVFQFTSNKEYELAFNILKRVSLTEFSEAYGKNLSYGQQKLVTLACCLANNPILLLLDEPIAGIDSGNQEKIKQIILDLKKEGKTILQIEHNLDYIQSTSDEVFYLDETGILKI